MSTVKAICLGVLGCAGLAATAVSGSRVASAQDQRGGRYDAVASAPKGGVALVQDDDSVYLYDAELRRLLIIKKSATEEGGRPVTFVFDMDKAKN